MARRALNDKTSNVNQSYLKRGFSERLSNVVISLHSLKLEGEKIAPILGSQNKDQRLAREIQAVVTASELLAFAMRPKNPGPRPSSDLETNNG